MSVFLQHISVYNTKYQLFYNLCFFVGQVVISVPPTVNDKAVQNETKFIRCEASYDQELDLVYVWNLNGHRINITKDFHYEQVTYNTHNLLFFFTS